MKISRFEFIGGGKAGFCSPPLRNRWRPVFNLRSALRATANGYSEFSSFYQVKNHPVKMCAKHKNSIGKHSEIRYQARWPVGKMAFLAIALH